jgi:hypothetical protein
MANRSKRSSFLKLLSDITLVLEKLKTLAYKLFELISLIHFLYKFVLHH